MWAASNNARLSVTTLSSSILSRSSLTAVVGAPCNTHRRVLVCVGVQVVRPTKEGNATRKRIAATASAATKHKREGNPPHSTLIDLLSHYVPTQLTQLDQLGQLAQSIQLSAHSARISICVATHETQHLIYKRLLHLLNLLHFIN